MNAMFTTNQYKVLEVMYENTLSIADKEYCPLGQGEIADELGLSRAVVNKIFTDSFSSVCILKSFTCYHLLLLRTHNL